MILTSFDAASDDNSLMSTDVSHARFCDDNGLIAMIVVDGGADAATAAAADDDHNNHDHDDDDGHENDHDEDGNQWYYFQWRDSKCPQISLD